MEWGKLHSIQKLSLGNTPPRTLVKHDVHSGVNHIFAVNITERVTQQYKNTKHIQKMCLFICIQLYILIKTWCSRLKCPDYLIILVLYCY